MSVPSLTPSLFRRRPRVVVARALVLVLAVTATTLALMPTRASADEVHPRADTFAVSGHGWGHGRGMSQQGAHGAAVSGLSYRSIVGFYYPGTSLTTAADGGIRVRLSGDFGLKGTTSSSMDIGAGPGLTARDLATGRSLLLPGDRDRWRVLSNGAGQLRLQGRFGGTWQDQSLQGATSAIVAGPVQLSETDGVLRRWYPGETARDYRGTLQAVATGVTTMDAVNHLAMETYLRAVVPAEMPASWHTEALQAQSVAARSYSSQRRADSRQRFPDRAWDICDSTACQVYAGASAESPRTNDAITATTRELLMYAGAPVFAEFSASNGGWTVAGGPAYQVAKRDPYDGITGSDSHSWKALLRAAELERAFPAVGRLLRLRIVERDGNGEWGGRIRTVVLEGVDTAGQPTSVTKTGREIYLSRAWPGRVDGLRSDWFTITSTSASDPIGSLDVLSSSSTGERLRGWALDRDTSLPVKVHVYVDGRLVVGATADAPRPDVGRAFPGYGDNHGYDVPLKLSDGAHEVCVYAINAADSGGSNRQVGCRSLSVRHLPFGAFDSTGSGPGTVSASGWSIDPDTAAPTGVHLYVDGALAQSAVADRPRADVGRIYPAYGDRHGYSLSTPSPAAEGLHSLCVYALNVAGTAGANPRLGCRSVSVRHTPFGALDGAGPTAGGLTVHGWTIDPDTSASNNVHVYLDGRLVVGATAANPRADVGRAYPGFGDLHGYRVAIPAAKGTHSVCVYAINAGGTPGGNPALGCRTVTV